MSWLSDIQKPLKPDYLILSGIEPEVLKLILQKYVSSKLTSNDPPLIDKYRPGIVVYAHTKNRLVITFEQKLALDTVFSIFYFLTESEDFPEGAAVAGWTTVQTLHEQLLPLWDKRITIYPGQNEEGGFCLNITTEEDRNFRFDLVNGVFGSEETSQFIEKSYILKWPRRMLFSVRPVEERSEFFEHLDNMSFYEMVYRAAAGWSLYLLYTIGALSIAAFIAWLTGNLQL